MGACAEREVCFERESIKAIRTKMIIEYLKHKDSDLNNIHNTLSGVLRKSKKSKTGALPVSEGLILEKIERKQVDDINEPMEEKKEVRGRRELKDFEEENHPSVRQESASSRLKKKLIEKYNLLELREPSKEALCQEKIISEQADANKAEIRKSKEIHKNVFEKTEVDLSKINKKLESEGESSPGKFEDQEVTPGGDKESLYASLGKSAYGFRVVVFQILTSPIVLPFELWSQSQRNEEEKRIMQFCVAESSESLNNNEKSSQSTLRTDRIRESLSSNEFEKHALGISLSPITKHGLKIIPGNTESFTPVRAPIVIELVSILDEKPIKHFFYLQIPEVAPAVLFQQEPYHPIIMSKDFHIGGHMNGLSLRIECDKIGLKETKLSEILTSNDLLISEIANCNEKLASPFALNESSIHISESNHIESVQDNLEDSIKFDQEHDITNLELSEELSETLQIISIIQVDEEKSLSKDIKLREGGFAFTCNNRACSNKLQPESKNLYTNPEKCMVVPEIELINTEISGNLKAKNGVIHDDNIAYMIGKRSGSSNRDTNLELNRLSSSIFDFYSRKSVDSLEFYRSREIDDSNNNKYSNTHKARVLKENAIDKPFNQYDSLRNPNIKARISSSGLLFSSKNNLECNPTAEEKLKQEFFE